MTLSAGTRLGPYEILVLIGAGGMGQVYKARDTRLDRAVAIKLLPPDLADRPDRRQRFETEARAISSLSHPNICTLFDVGEQDGRAFIVMEYLEGETLDDRLRLGPLPADDLLRWGGQIADALDHAHRHHIVHRDLKPSNVMLTRSGPKLLDFGLAKARGAEPTGLATTSDDRTLTAEGTLIGTFQYMTPEQLEGRPADARTDIFAFGVLLYEMATGRKAFDGDSQANLIASILTAQPPPISSVRDTKHDEAFPQALDHVVERCLAKNPGDRWQTARDIKLELDWSAKGGSIRSPTSQPVTKSGRKSVSAALAWLVAALAVAAAVTIGVLNLRTPEPETTRFTIPPPPGTIIGQIEIRSRLAISPDGQHLAFQAAKDGRVQIWIRSLDSLEAYALAGTDGGFSPFWSPDSRFIGFFAAGAGELKRVDLSGGPARTICAALSEGRPTWGRDGTILFTQFRDGLYRVAADGGTPVRVTQLDKALGEMNHFWPSFLPDGRRFLYTATARDANGVRVTPSIYVSSLDSSDKTLVTRMHSGMVYSPSAGVLFVEDGVLMAQGFDTTSLGLLGDPVSIADGVGYYKELGHGGFTVSETGVLAYQGNDDTFQLLWYDRRGSVWDPGWERKNFGTVRLSPDGDRFAADLVDPRTGMSDVWIYDVSQGASIRLTSDGFASAPVWSPDGRRVVLSTSRSGAPALAVRALDGSEEPLANPRSPSYPEDWSNDGKWVAYTDNTRTTGRDLWIVPLAGDRKASPLFNSAAVELGARFSPDSRWIAFVSDEAGAEEVYVAPLGSAAKTRISVGGGSSPRWRRDGKELFYVAGDNRSIMAVAVESGSTFKAGIPKRLFTLRTETTSRIERYTGYDVSPDGQRFLVSVPVDLASSRITVILNWTSALKR